DAICRGGLPNRARRESRSVRAERRLRSGGRATVSAPLDFARAARPGSKTVSRGELPRSGFYRYVGAAGAFRDQVGLGHGARGRGVLVKAPKSGQDLRFDLPTIGPRTIEAAGVAGLAGIAVIAGETTVVEAQVMIEAADAAGLFVIGVPA